jgi:hypothetical protein
MSADAVRLTLAPVKALDSGKIVSAEEAASLIETGTRLQQADLSASASPKKSLWQ